MTHSEADTVVLGVGNVLLRDEGVGVHMIHRLRRKYEFPEHVDLVDGGTLGLNLLSVVCGCRRLVVIDAVRNGGEPGEVFVLRFEELPFHVRAKNSLHQVDLVEAITLAGLISDPPETIIVGIEPLDTEGWGTELTPPVMNQITLLEERVLEQLKFLGVCPQERCGNFEEDSRSFPFGEGKLPGTP